MKLNIHYLLLIAMLLIALPSASAILDHKMLDPSNSFMGYPAIIHKDFLGQEVQSFELTEHTQYCLTNCESIVKIKLNYEMPLTNDIRLIDNDDKIVDIPYSIQYNDGKIEDYIEDIPIYEEVCSSRFNSTTSHMDEICDQELIRIDKITKQRFVWNNYTFGDKLPIGEYQLKIKGNLNGKQSIDWQIKSNGLWNTEQAVWTSSFNVGLVAYFDGNSTVNLISAYPQVNITALQGTAISGSTESCLIGKCLNISGNNNFKIPANQITNFSKNYTLNIWARGKTYDTGGSNGPFFMASPVSNLNMLGFDSPSTTIVYAGSFWTGTGGNLAGATVPSNGWFMATVTGQDGNVSVYINATLKRSGITGTAQNYQEDTYLGTDYGLAKDWLGQFDEISYWNRTLTSDEVSSLYNSGVGLTYDLLINYPTVTMPIPASANYTTSPNAIVFNCSSNYTDTLVLWINGQINKSIYSGGIDDNLSLQITNNLGNGNYSYNCSANSTATGTIAWTDNRFIIVDAIAPTINITKPFEFQNFTSFLPIYNVSINFSQSDNLGGVGLNTCWWFNGTANLTIACGKNDSINLSGGNYQIMYYANDTFNNINSMKRNFSINSLIVSTNYSLTAIEGENTTFIFNVTATALNQANASLNYNGTNYPMNQYAINTTDASFYTSIASPFVNGGDNLVFFNVSYNLNNVHYNTSIYNQTVYNINPLSVAAGQGCSGNLSYSFNLFDEVSISTMLNGTYIYNINYGLSNTSFVNTNGTIAGSTNISVCVNGSQTGQYRIGFGKIVYSAIGDGYSSPRTYYFGADSLMLPASNVNLYLINSSTTGLTSVVAKILDSNLVPLKNINVNMFRYYPLTDLWTSVQQDVSDELGQTIFQIVQNTVNYRFVLSQAGSILYTTDTIKIVCYSTPCQIELKIPSTTVNPGKYYTNQSGVSYILSYDNNTQTASLLFNSIDGASKTMQLYVQQVNISEKRVICSNFSTGTSGLLTCNITAFTGNFLGQAYLNTTSGSKLLETITMSTANFFRTTGTEGVLWFIIFIIGLALIGIWNPIVSIGLVAAGFVLMGVLGVISIGWTIIVSVVILSGIGIWLLKT